MICTSFHESCGFHQICSLHLTLHAYKISFLRNFYRKNQTLLMARRRFSGCTIGSRGGPSRSLRCALLAAISTRIRNRRTVAQALESRQWVRDLRGGLSVQMIPEYIQLWHLWWFWCRDSKTGATPSYRQLHEGSIRTSQGEVFHLASFQSSSLSRCRATVQDDWVGGTRGRK